MSSLDEVARIAEAVARERARGLGLTGAAYDAAVVDFMSGAGWMLSKTLECLDAYGYVPTKTPEGPSDVH